MFNTVKRCNKFVYSSNHVCVCLKNNVFHNISIHLIVMPCLGCFKFLSRSWCSFQITRVYVFRCNRGCCDIFPSFLVSCHVLWHVHFGHCSKKFFVSFRVEILSGPHGIRNQIGYVGLGNFFPSIATCPVLSQETTSGLVFNRSRSIDALPRIVFGMLPDISSSDNPFATSGLPAIRTVGISLSINFPN